jgi:anti-sigma B factor antagonist
MSARGRRRADEPGAVRLPTALRSPPMMKEFEVHAARVGDAPGVALRGEVDLDVAPDLELALETAILESVGAFVVDLSELDFIETSGVHALLRARGVLGREDRALAVVCPHGPVRRVFELTGVSDLFALYSTREEAAAALSPAD